MRNLPEQEPLFELQAVWHTYAGIRPVDALHGIDLAIYPGEYVAIIGANGSGKSTLGRHLNALLLPTGGQVRVAGIPTDDEARRAEIRRRVQMVFQQPDYQIVATSVAEDVAFGAENFAVPDAELPERVQTALQTVGLWPLRARPPHMLSGGEKQRLAIAGALAVRPQAIVLDEAMAMLDPAGRSAVLALLRRLHDNGTTIVTITHEMDETAVADRIIVLHEGQIILDDEPRRVFAQAERLRSLALDIPHMADLSLRLGLPVCLTPAELLTALGPPPPESVKASRQIAARQDSPPKAAARRHPIIEIQDLRHTYLRGTPLANEALQGIDVIIEQGALTGLIGQTGSGKSTLLQHLNGLLRPQAGHVFVAGKDWADPKLDVRKQRLQVGLLFQQPEDQLFERYVGDDVAFGPRQMKLDRQAVRQRVQSAMDAVGLPFELFKDRPTQSLSGGERRRAALAGVLALQPKILAADEPTASLDPQGRAQILEILQQLNQDGGTVILSSHRLEDIALLCEQVVALRDGQVIAHDVPANVLNGPAVGEYSLPVHPLVNLGAVLREAGWPAPRYTTSVQNIADLLRPYLKSESE